MNTANCDLFLFFQAKNKIYVVSPYATDPKKGPTLKKKVVMITSRRMAKPTKWPVRRPDKEGIWW